jgi:hypothetical protein
MPLHRLCVVGFLLVGLAACQQDAASSDKPDSDESWVVVHNETGVTLVELNVAPSPGTGLGWGDNQFGEDTLKHGKSFTLKAVPCPDEYDLRALSADGGEATRGAVSLECGESFDWEVNGFSGT